MSSSSRTIRGIRVVTLVLLVAACQSDSSDVVAPPGGPPQGPPPGSPLTSGTVTVNRSALLLTAVGQSRVLSAQTTNEGGSAVNAAVTWTSSAPDRVSVDETGRVTARAIGSAQIFATSGVVRSAPVFVMVAEPAPGALLVTDAQVVSVGPTVGLAPGEVPGPGTQYEVRLTGIATTPSSGTIVLAAENAAVAGKVVSTRTESGVLVVTLAVTPLYELLVRYDINWKIDLSTLPAAAGQAPGGASANLSSATGSTSVSPSILKVINAINCDGSLGAVLASRTVNLTPTGSLTLEVNDTQGYTRRALVGQMKLVGTVSFKLNAVAKFSGNCQVKVPISIPIGGLLAVGIMPEVVLGVGVGLEGGILLTAGEFTLTGEQGTEVELGWECGGATPACRSLPGLKTINKLTPKYQVFSPEAGMRVEFAGSLYLFADLNAKLFLGVASANILSAKAGVVQSVDLGFEEDQAIVTSYSSKYDLKAEVVIEPGSFIQKLLQLTYTGFTVNIGFQGKASYAISESPKGTLTVSRSRVNLSGATVDMRVDLNNTDYAFIGYNVVRVELWQKRATESQFKVLRAFNVTASNQTIFQHAWQPTTQDIGENEFAVFVYTQFPVPGLEIADNSIKKVEVQCFSARTVALTTGAASTCTDTWVGTTRLFVKDQIQVDATVTWQRDPNIPEIDGDVSYVATGTATVTWIDLTNDGCTAADKVFPIKGDFVKDNNTMLVEFAASPVNFFIQGEIALHTTVSCPNMPPFFYPLNMAWIIGFGTVNKDGNIQGRYGTSDSYYEWSFQRPP